MVDMFVIKEENQLPALSHSTDNFRKANVVIHRTPITGRHLQCELINLKEHYKGACKLRLRKVK